MLHKFNAGELLLKGKKFLRLELFGQANLQLSTMSGYEKLNENYL